MTTIVDPAGTPAIVYNRSGTVIVPITANGNNQTDAAEIPNISGRQIVMIMAVTNDFAVKVHPDAEIGTILECYHQLGGNHLFQVFSAAGQKINGYGNGYVEQPTSRGLLLRKVAADDWRVVGGA